MQRRQLIKLAAALPLAGMSTQLFAAPAAPAKLLVVFLRGAYDAASALVPLDSELYYTVRPNIAIPRAQALALDAQWGMHPALASLMPLWQARQLAFIPYAGSEDSSRSHFESQDRIEAGLASSGRIDTRSGFMNRLALALGNSARPWSFTRNLPLVFAGPGQVPNLALEDAGRNAPNARQADLIAAMYRGNALESSVREGLAARQDMAQSMQGEMQAASRNAIGARGFEAQAARLALWMRDKADLGFVDVGGGDTHVGQGAVSGNLADRLGELARGLASFAQGMGPAWNKTVVVVMSEFGRTVRENGNRGTDHGHGSVYWLLGGALAGARMAGEQVALTRANLFQDRDLPVLNEYRALLAGLFGRMYGLSPAMLDAVFPGARARDLKLV